MPRLNSGTLLENIVILEATRVCFDHMMGEESFAFASAFAMPPLTQCWCTPNDERGSPFFGYAALLQMAAAPHHPQTIQELWSLCLNNQPQ